MLDLIKIVGLFYKIATWGDYIRGEYWIDLNGFSLFADIDIGEAGHESIAIDQMLDKDILIEGLSEESLLTEEAIKEYEDDESGASYIFFTENIPDNIGIEAAGSKERWDDLKKDARLAYAKHEGAIAVVNENFYCWNLTNKTINAIQDFLFENYDPLPTSDIVIEEGFSGKYARIPIKDFITIKHPGELWRSPV